ncbi:MAG: adenosylmethionine--8-amino-7-oxononanoate transaminase [Pseudomonadota bacterium]
MSDSTSEQSNNTSHQYDIDHIWHPYTSMKTPSPTFQVESAQGVYLKLANGQQLIDGMSSWWAAIHGYNHPVLNQAINTQLQKMSHVMFGGLTHQPAIELAKTLIEITDPSLDYVFFSDSGSVAVEVAIKMALQYWVAQGVKNKHKLLTIRNGYHGDTFASMSVCDPINGMHSIFQGVLNTHFFADAPQCKNDKEWNSEDINSFKFLLEQHQQTIAAVILEPIVQGAGGMRIYCPEYLRQVRKLCDEYNVLLILDEIATGFGRTGTLFAYQQANIVPDILCLGKALTGGYMTLAATLCNKKVVDGIHFDNGEKSQGVLMHGPTFMANPLACAVAKASIDLLLNSEWQSHIKNIEQQLNKELIICQHLSIVKEVRVIGAIGVVELHHNVDMNWIQARFVKAGVWIRPFNKLVYLMPPYIISKEELTILTTSILIVLKEMENFENL